MVKAVKKLLEETPPPPAYIPENAGQRKAKGDKEGKATADIKKKGASFGSTRNKTKESAAVDVQRSAVNDGYYSVPRFQ